MRTLKELLKDVWISQVTEEPRDQGFLEKKFGADILRDAREKGLIDGTDEVRLTEKGREGLRVVLCGGVFDILHPGHGFFLERAKSYGDVLVVVVARDSTVEKRKRIPVVPEKQRRDMVSYLKPVDVAVLGGTGHPLDIVGDIRPDIIVLGPDQRHSEERLRRALSERGVRVEVVRVEEYKECPLYSTKNILEKIIERGYPK
jgi:FAD synthetase